MNGKTALVMAIVALLTAGCGSDARQARGFSLPEGDVTRGKQAFVALRCDDCHSVADIARNPDTTEQDIHIELGGMVRSVKTYGELVTSVINPSHRISRGYPTEATTAQGHSRMRVYNEVMTVRQLVDIVTFLQTEYEVQPYPETYYRVYYP